MANSLITAQWVARKALVLLHAKSNFTGRTNRDYQSLLPGPINGVILGQQLSIRLPFQYTLRTGPQMNAQNSVQRIHLRTGTESVLKRQTDRDRKSTRLNSSHANI